MASGVATVLVKGQNECTDTSGVDPLRNFGVKAEGGSSEAPAGVE